MKTYKVICAQEVVARFEVPRQVMLGKLGNNYNTLDRAIKAEHPEFSKLNYKWYWESDYFIMEYLSTGEIVFEEQ